MTISVVDLFSIGIGPSSSHTVGPMKAAKLFLEHGNVHAGDHVEIILHGSLAATGKGHGTDRAVLLGLAGLDPATVDPAQEPTPGADVEPTGCINGIFYSIVFDPTPLPEHPNGLSFSCNDVSWRYFSVGGGFVLREDEMANQAAAGAAAVAVSAQSLPFPFTTSTQLLQVCADSGLSIPAIMRANEEVLHGDFRVMSDHLDRVWATMQECVKAGMRTSGILPGGLGVQRRAADLYKRLASPKSAFGFDALAGMEWINLYALAVNEENAAGGRVVTAPTNGAAGIIPAVMHYIRDFCAPKNEKWPREFLLAAGAVGMIIKENASISGAEVGCQGEVGSAAAMAAAGLCQVIGGTPKQVENAAEIALEHNLGLTCDPVGGLVQIPCIERNAIAAVKAVNAARLALHGSGVHRVTLDDAVATMAATGHDMMSKYKETATGGLAVMLGLPVTITEC
ncbi:L-serine ammonia-lyase [Corynebacterium felinum]|uniref:L-serine dehydratase n=1 Tax=Corynebacterium felinum TaxID=131318 RepID=A0ABU2BAX2_9CORY|nr:L-serine ammonia-lyase [Corynebacterium felinum]MDF5821921.1 L-serine ammonia-lyase [Corynebacterium felinum]MDR7355787.1 L-serine dehydratase [Corynebacterium felinum]WJY95133.1 L-serine dehydratase 1 [Corynebacterium felinum]